MNKLIRRIVTTTASVAVVGTALVGTAGAASAAPLHTEPKGHVLASVLADRDGGRHDNARHDHHSRHHDRHSRGRWESWHHGKDGFWYRDSHDHRHQYRYDGHRYYRWSGGKWVVIVLKDHHRGALDGWYINRLFDAKK